MTHKRKVRSIPHAVSKSAFEPGHAQHQRLYRQQVRAGCLCTYRVVVKETDVQVHSEKCLPTFVRDRILIHRGYIESYIQAYPAFARTLTPWDPPLPAPHVIREMTEAAHAAGTGPMAAVAGVIAQAVGQDLLGCCRQVIVENGGDIFIKTDRPCTVAIFAGASPLSMRMGIRIDVSTSARAVCTSSGTVGHSLSMGRADAVSILADSCALADASATAVGNHLGSTRKIKSAIAIARRIEGVKGGVIIIGNQSGVWGDLELVPL
jgi:ApbE superfamily uncharacterized protein (UPF0280 family)